MTCVDLAVTFFTVMDEFDRVNIHPLDVTVYKSGHVTVGVTADNFAQALTLFGFTERDTLRGVGQGYFKDIYVWVQQYPLPVEEVA